MSLEQIVSTAIELADTEGAVALSLRRIASKLSVSPMSLYWYVESKDDLVDLVIDAIHGEDTLPPSSGDWRAFLMEVACRSRAMLHRHSWLAPLIGGRALLGPNVLRRTECLLGTLSPLVEDMTTTMALLGTLNAYIHGFVMAELGDLDIQSRSGIDKEAWRLLLGPFVQEHIIDSGKYPNLALYIVEGEHRKPDFEFNFGVGCILDGLATHVR